MSNISINPASVIENANELERLGARMKAKMSEVNAKVKSLSGDWQDNAQRDYDATFNKLVAAFDSFAETIPAFANEARAHAEQMLKIGH